MTDNAPVIPASNTDKKCFEHEHLSPALHGFLDVCRAVSKGNGRRNLYFSGENMAYRFAWMGTATAYLYARELVERGWLKVIKPSITLPTGRKSATVYFVLDHEQWAAEHPHACEELAAEKAKRRALQRAKKLTKLPLQHLERSTSPLQISSPPLQISSPPLQISSPPLHTQVGNSYKATHTYQLIGATDTPSTTADSGVADSFFNHYLSQAERKRESAKKLGGAPTAPVSGVAVSDTPATELVKRAEQVLEPFTRRLGIDIGLYRIKWVEGVTSLLANGQSDAAVQEAITYSINKYGDAIRRQQDYGFVEWFKRMQHEIAEDAGTKMEAA